MRKPDPLRQVRAAARGDQSARKGLYDRYRGLVLAACLSVVRRRDLAEDAAEEAWAQILASLAKFRGRSALSSWLYRVAANTARHLLRSERRRRSREEASRRGTTSPATADAAAREAVALLPLSLRVPFVLATFGGCSCRECARTLRIPIGTVKSRISRARARIREIL